MALLFSIYIIIQLYGIGADNQNFLWTNQNAENVIWEVEHLINYCYITFKDLQLILVSCLKPWKFYCLNSILIAYGHRLRSSNQTTGRFVAKIVYLFWKQPKNEWTKQKLKCFLALHQYALFLFCRKSISGDLI